jgi:hypothetical protein
MAIDRKVITSEFAANTNLFGYKPNTSVIPFEFAATDVDGSVLRILPNLPAEAVILDIQYCCDAMAGFTAMEIGLYHTLDGDMAGAVIDANCFLASADPHAGVAISAKAGGMNAVDIANLGKKAYEFAGYTKSTNKWAAFDLAITGTTRGTATGSMTVVVTWIQP